MAQAFSPEMKDANLDWESITAIIQEGEREKIVEVEDEVDHKTVEIWVGDGQLLGPNGSPLRGGGPKNADDSPSGGGRTISPPWWTPS